MPRKPIAPSHFPACTFELTPGLRYFFFTLTGVLLLITLAVMAQSIRESRTRDENEQKAALLERHVVQLREQLDRMTATTTQQQSEQCPPANARLLLTQDNANDLLPNGLPDGATAWKTEMTEKTIQYINKEKGFSTSLPYDPAWGNQQYTMSPYDEAIVEGAQTVAFGPISFYCAEGGCGWNRRFHLAFLPTRTADEAITSFDAEEKGYAHKSSKTTINGLQVVRLELDDVPTSGKQVWFEVVGKKSNAVFVPFWMLKDTADNEIIDAIKTIEQVN